MAKSSTLRVYELAKELGVQSKAVVEKCQAEGVPGIDNHMSTVKVGLAMTIRQWFGEAQEKTAVETTDKVDLKRVKRPARRKAKAKTTATAGGEDEGEGVEGGGTATLVAEEEEIAETTASTPEEPEEVSAEDAAEQPAAVEVKARVREMEEQVQESQRDAVADAAASAAEVDTRQAAAFDGQPAAAAASDGQPEANGEAESKEEEDVRPLGVVNVPVRPDVVKPQGTKVEPKEAKLRGPKVVRIEKPEPVRRPGPRPRPRRRRRARGRPHIAGRSAGHHPIPRPVPRRGRPRRRRRRGGRGHGTHGPRNGWAPRRRRGWRRRRQAARLGQLTPITRRRAAPSARSAHRGRHRRTRGQAQGLHRLHLPSS